MSINSKFKLKGRKKKGNLLLINKVGLFQFKSQSEIVN